MDGHRLTGLRCVKTRLSVGVQSTRRTRTGCASSALRALGRGYSSSEASGRRRTVLRGTSDQRSAAKADGRYVVPAFRLRGCSCHRRGRTRGDGSHVGGSKGHPGSTPRNWCTFLSLGYMSERSPEWGRRSRGPRARPTWRPACEELPVGTKARREAGRRGRETPRGGQRQPVVPVHTRRGLRWACPRGLLARSAAYGQAIPVASAHRRQRTRGWPRG
jgi:hypothetical protein